MSDRIGELLVRENLISLPQLKEAQSAQRSNRESLTYTLAKMGFVNDHQLTTFLSRHYGYASFDLSDFELFLDNSLTCYW